MQIQKINSCQTSFNGGFTQRAEAEIKNIIKRNHIEQGVNAFEGNAELLRSIFLIKQNPKKFVVDLNPFENTTFNKYTRYLDISVKECIPDYYRKNLNKSPFPISLCEYYNPEGINPSNSYMKSSPNYNTHFTPQLADILLKFGIDWKYIIRLPVLKDYKAGQSVQEKCESFQKLEKKYLDFLKDMVQMRWGTKCVENNPDEKALIEWLFK